MRKASWRHERGVGILAILLLVLGGPSAQAAKRAAKKAEAGGGEPKLAPAAWLILGPEAVPLPAFHDSDARAFGAAELLDQAWLQVDDLWPEAGQSLPGIGGEMSWQERPAPLGLEGRRESPAVALAAAFLAAERFSQATLEIKTRALARVFLDGEQLASRTSAAAPEEVSAELALTPGKHILLLQIVLPASAGGEESTDSVSLEASLRGPAKPEGGPGLAGLSFSTDPRHGMRLVDVLDAPAVTGVDLAPDGAHLAIHLRRPTAPPEDGGDIWTQILRVADGASVRALRGGESGFTWAPDGKRYCYQTAKKGEDVAGQSDLWVASLEDGEARRILEGVEGLGSVLWLPEGESLIYQAAETSEADPRGVKLYRGLNDRWGGFRDHGHLFQVNVESGARRRLTAGPDDVTFLDLDPQGRHVLLSLNRYQPTVWPYTRDDLYQLDLKTLEASELGSVPWFRSGTYDRSGEGVLVLAGPSSFGVEGLASEELRQGMAQGTAQANEYDTELYRLGSGGQNGAETAEPLTRDFDPAVEEIAWSGEDLLVRAQVEDRVGLFLRTAGEKTFTSLAGDVENVQGMDGAETGGVVAYYGASVDHGQTVFVRSLADDAPRELYRATGEMEDRLRLGAVEEWSFTSGEDEIQGRLHLPPDFDAEKTYPLIVYYYGGTVPTERSFADRYPFNVWTAQGYVVYVLQPSGATGYGQDFSARHVNNWGRTVADEIVRGTEEVLVAHPYLDGKHVGCIGASYGGFMTLYLLTRTDLFAGAVAHAGISSISSYWGQGNWGYLYSAQASARSFPWSDRELFVDQSPLFAADKITTPLLLLHGTADTNVPTGESQQMYTALEMLGKEVELITFEGEDHRIISRDKRLVWSQTILAWFAWKLKDQPEWWRSLYGNQDAPKG